MTTVLFRGENKPLATNLRVAYAVQGQHNHKSYMDVFTGIDEMSLPQQVGIIFLAFTFANKDIEVTEEEFFNEFLDTNDVSSLMETLTQIIEGIMGKELVERVEQSKAEKGESKNE